jgi:signal peptidase II
MRAVPLNRYAIFFSIALVGCAADLLTKSYVFAWLGMPSGRVHWLIHGVFGWQTSLNEGALFGMGQGMVPLFAAASVVAAIGILTWLFWFGAAQDRLLTVALGCVMAGVFGNLYDRLGLPGLSWPEGFPGHVPGDPVYAVRDFILVMIGDWPWPTFNIADSLLVSGAILLVGHAFWTGQPDSSGAAAKTDAEPGTGS